LVDGLPGNQAVREGDSAVSLQDRSRDFEVYIYILLDSLVFRADEVVDPQSDAVEVGVDQGLHLMLSH
jgi:hypothetical protein